MIRSIKNKRKGRVARVKTYSKRVSVDLHDLIGSSQSHYDKKQSKRMEKDENKFFHVSDVIFKNKRDRKNFIVIINGARDSVCEGHKFVVKMSIDGVNYPQEPPKVKFVTRIFHPNITMTGTICLDILKDKWAPSLTFDSITRDLVVFMNNPNKNDPLDVNVNNIYVKDRKKYESIRKQMIKKFASEEATQMIINDWKNGTNNYERKYPIWRSPNYGGGMFDDIDYDEGLGLIDDEESGDDDEEVEDEDDAEEEDLANPTFETEDEDGESYEDAD